MSQLADFVQETATNPGKNKFVLEGAPVGRRLFSAAFPQGGRVFYFAHDGVQAEWGVGALDVSGPISLARDAIRGTTAGTKTALDFAGLVQIYNEVPAEFLPIIGDDGLARANQSILVDRDWLDANYADSVFLRKTYTQTGTFPPGVVIDFSGGAVPDGWLLCDGSAIKRVVYPALFAAIGTTYGPGDGTTTFSVPDLRERAVFGLDNMGYQAAGRVTLTGSAIDGGKLGAAGGSQYMQSHTHPFADPGHKHVLTEQEHWHTPKNGNGFVGIYSAGGELNAGFKGGGGYDNLADYRTAPAKTGITIANQDTGIDVTTSSNSGQSQNMPPAIMMNKIIYTGKAPKKVVTGPVLTAKATFSVPFTDTIPRTITWETADGTAISGLDYEETEGGLLIPPGWQSVTAYIPITPLIPGQASKTFDVIFKWYDKTAQPVGYGTGQLTGWPIYPVKRQTVTVELKESEITLDTSTLPKEALWSTRDGTAHAGTDYLAANGNNAAGAVTLVVAPTSKGMPIKTLYVDITDASGLIETRQVDITPPVLSTASALDTRVSVTTAVLPACVPEIMIDASATDKMPVSTMRALAVDWHIENQGSDISAQMTLTLSSSTCALQIFGNDFDGAYTQKDPGSIIITGNAETITAIRSNFQARPLASGAASITMALAAQDGTTSTVTYPIEGVLSSMSWQGLPAADAAQLNVLSPSTPIPNSGTGLTVANADPFVEMTLTIEPDEYGGWVLGPVGDAVSVSATGRGIVIKGSASVLAIVLVPLTIYVGEGITPQPTAGAHELTLTATDGTNTITAKYPYSVTL